MTKEELIKKLTPQLEQVVQTALEGVYADVVGEKNPDAVVTAGSQGVTLSTEDADVQQHLDFYSGKRTTKPTAMDNAKALMKQEEMIENGTMHKKYVTPEVHEEAMSRISIPGSLQKNLKDIKLGGKR